MRQLDLELARAIIGSPLGPLHLAASDDGLVEMLFAAQHPTPAGPLHERRGAAALGPPQAAACHPILAHAARELDAYFAGTLEAFTVPLAPRGTPFQIAVWQALVAIPFGARRAYRDIARALDKVGAERAVGAANGRNRIGIIVPCHRVVAADGSLTGYAGGLDKKQWLLAHESREAFALFG